MWEKIKKILSREGGKCIVVEDSQPTYIVMKLDDYEKMGQNDSSEIAEINRDVDHWKAEENAREEIKEEIKIEDLPF